MCTVVLGLQHNQQVPFFLAANRDEWKARPTTPFGPLDAAHTIFGGRDDKAHGTWSAYRPSDHAFAIVLNAKPGQPPNPALRSRGELPLRVIAEATPLAMGDIAAALDVSAYNPFWLLFGREHSWGLIGSEQPRVRWLEPGLHVVSNLGLDVAGDPKKETVDQERDALARHSYAETVLTLRGLLAHAPLHLDAGPYGSRWSQLAAADPERRLALWVSEQGEAMAPAQPFERFS